VRDLLGEPLGDRDHFYRLQPYVIALYTSKGVPMLWHGQEFGENWSVPSWGIGRNLFGRPLHWEYFYDTQGKALIRLYRIMGGLKRQLRCLSAGGFFYYFDDESHRRQGVIAFHRQAEAAGGTPQEDVLVLLNFWDQEAKVWLPFPRAGRWEEQIDRADAPRPPVDVAHGGERRPVRVAPNYGCVYLLT
jgi:1,4-alpha-glucan branching enzyme